MTISYTWLKDYLNIDLSIEKIAEILTSIGLEVESIEKTEAVKGGLKGVVVGHVLSCVEHPNSDHLHVTSVNIGQSEPIQVVCGAPNVAAGQKVPVATIGTVLYMGNEEVKIKKGKIRGEESCGMICAEDELGIGTSHEGIMILEDSAVPGTPFAEYLNLQEECVLEIGLTANRIDAASHIGVARDIAAYLQANGETIAVQKPETNDFCVQNHDLQIPIEVLNSEACPRYCGITLQNITIAPSPEWMQKRLSSIGIRPINNVVDITNFILHEMGQPLHAFDAEKIKGKKIVVRTCPEGTKFTTLDGIERSLSAEDLMICNAEEPMCMAGVFGGLDSGITETTTSVFIESAYFNPVSVRKTAKRHTLSTDSSFRFERGADPNITLYALKRAALLIHELAGGEIASEPQDFYPSPVHPFSVQLNYAEVDRTLGKILPRETIKTILKSLEMEIVSESETGLDLRVPNYRVDVQRSCDVIEDILRIYGYNHIEIPTHVYASLSHSPKPNKEKAVETAANLLSNQGFHEIMCLSLTNAEFYKESESYPSSKTVMLLNPNSIELNGMRQTLLFGGLETIAYNINRKNNDLKLYEFGNVYQYEAEKGKEENHLSAYSEDFRLALFTTGARHQQSWNHAPGMSDFYHLKKYTERLLARFGCDLNSLQTESSLPDFFSDGIAYKINGKVAIEMGIVNKKTRNLFGIKQEVFFAEIRWNAIMKQIKGLKVSYTELPKFPEVRRDLALLVDQSVDFKSIREIAEKTEKKLLKKVELFDVYEGDKLPQGKKSYAVSFILQDLEKTLTDTQIDKIMEQLLSRIKTGTGAELR